MTLPPLSVSIPLHKAPSGHLVMVIDDYEEVTTAKGGIPEASLQLHAASAPSAPQTATSRIILGGTCDNSNRPAKPTDSRAVTFDI